MRSSKKLSHARRRYEKGFCMIRMRFRLLWGILLLLLFMECRTPYGAYVFMEEYEYLVQLPQNYDAQDACPLILFLHGYGCGSLDVEIYKQWGLGRYADEHPDFPFVVVAPQTPTDWYPEPLADILDNIIAEYKIDTDRIYATGFSMGGYGTFMVAMAYPDRFAAIAPVCGYSNPAEAGRIRYVPVWMFHNDYDPVVPHSESQKMLDALQALGGDVRLTTYFSSSHDAWTETYANPELYEWFLSHTLDDPEP